MKHANAPKKRMDIAGRVAGLIALLVVAGILIVAFAPQIEVLLKLQAAQYGVGVLSVAFLLLGFWTGAVSDRRREEAAAEKSDSKGKPT